MRIKTKLVDIYVKSPCMNCFDPVKSDCYGVTMTTGDIRINITRGNTVYEILDNGNRLLLNRDNYDKENNVATDTSNRLSEPVKPVKKSTMKETLAETAKIKEPVEEEVKEPIKPAKVEPKIEDVKPVEEEVKEEKQPEVKPFERKYNNNNNSNKNKNNKKK